MYHQWFVIVGGGGWWYVVVGGGGLWWVAVDGGLRRQREKTTDFCCLVLGTESSYTNAAGTPIATLKWGEIIYIQIYIYSCFCLCFVYFRSFFFV